MKLWGLILLTAGPAVFDQNLLTNAGFETGNLTGWSVTRGTAVVISDDARSGSRAVRLDNAEIRQGWINVQAGRVYKAFAWLRLVSESGSDWGGVRVEVVDSNWQSLAHSGDLHIATHGTNWFKVALKFMASTSRVLLQMGYFGGSGRAQVAHVDDCALIEDTPGNLPPEVTATLSPNPLTAPATLIYALTGDDPDGAVAQVVWDFGDGARAFGWQGTRTVGVPGRYVVRVFVADDEGMVVTQRVAWTVLRPAFPALDIRQPATGEIEVDTSPLHFSGTATNVVRVEVSTDRGFFGLASGTESWSAAVPLQPGWNRVTVQGRDATGQIITQTRRVCYVPAEPLAVTDLRESPHVVERWEPLEITFRLASSAATHSQFPYETNAPPGLEWVDGVTVDGVFTPDNWQTVYRRPGFLWQEYTRALRNNEEWLYPTNPPRWCIRFAPPQLGNWQYRVEVCEARGSVTSAPRTFQVVAPTQPNNRGPVRVSARDSRYFEFADGTPFLGGGHGLGFSDERYSYDAETKFNQIGAGNQTFFRWWISGHLWGSAWQPWASRTLSYEGTVPPTGLSLESAFGDGLAAWKLDARNPILFQGFMSGHAALISGRIYRVRIRWRTEGVTGPSHAAYPYGICVKRTGWPEPGRTLTTPVTVPHVHGDTPWHVATGTFVASGHLLHDNLSIILENVSGGRAFVDECVLEEDLGEGRWGPNLLRTPRANSHYTYDPRRGAGIDHILREAQRRGLYFKLVISEKQEFLLNHLAPTGLPDPQGGHFNRGAGSPTRRLHEYYWRHLSARLGAFRSVHSWELVNEEAPGPGEHFRLTAAAALQADQDGNPHPVSTSTWAGLATNAWKHPDSAPIHYVDFHAYVRGTGWIQPRDELANDSARFFAEYDRAARAADFGKPVVWGEMGIDGPATTDDQDPALARDPQGVWLHKILWARCGPGGVYPLYWWDDHIFNKSLHALYGNWNRFMAGLPLNNGRYVDAAARSSNPGVRVLGQKDLVAGRAHLWLDNSHHTWRAVVDGRAIPAQTATISLDLGPPNAAYTLTWFDTRSGQATGAETRTADPGGVFSFAVTNLASDVAVKIERVLSPRAAWRLQHFGTADNSGAAADEADPDGDGLVNLVEYAFGLDPLQPDRVPVEAAVLDDRLTLTYPRRRPPADVSYVVSGAFDLSGPWEIAGVIETILGPGELLQTNRAFDSVPVSSGRRRFLRLGVVLNP